MSPEDEEPQGEVADDDGPDDDVPDDDVPTRHDPEEDAASPEPPPVLSSVVSSVDIGRREADALFSWYLHRPGFWRTFIRRRIALVASVVVLLAVVEVYDVGGGGGALRGALFFGPVLAGLIAFDVWFVRRRYRQATRASVRPPGSVLEAAFHPDRVEFTVTRNSTTVRWDEVRSAVRRDGVLTLAMEGEGDEAIMVPDELLTPPALEVLRGALGYRLLEV